MRTMFRDAFAFNQSIGEWVPSQVTDMRGMFDRATAFNKPLNSWGVSLSNVGDFTNMFTGATVFNQCLDSWKDQINSNPSNFIFQGTSCPDEDCTSAPVCPTTTTTTPDDSRWCENLDALDYALLDKKGKLATKQCLLHSLIEDYNFPDKLPSWSRASQAGLTSVLCFILVSLVVAAAAWRIRRQGSLVYEAL
ncbi:unnamed protein product [Symbiodinium necroappetens]|uniref:BspA family leucine-rich repeat surface protein n=1 Tax=Symbiodinium necroappetens TaxID=1628268 RepID=A0A813BB22_9DINO|nr:unnamed protein product [Symbiodinium necroappetens]